MSPQPFFHPFSSYSQKAPIAQAVDAARPFRPYFPLGAPERA